MSNAFFCDNKDFLFAIWVFKTLGWSNRRIAKLLSTSHPTINQLVSRAYAYGNTFKSSSFAKSGKGSVRYVGSSKDLEYINAKVNQNICGGGRRKPPRNYNSNWEIGDDNG